MITVASPGGKQSQAGGALYPNLLADYSVISMPSSEDCHDIHKLLPMAQQLSTSLNSNVSTMESVLHKSTKGISSSSEMELCSYLSM